MLESHDAGRSLWGLIQDSLAGKAWHVTSSASVTQCNESAAQDVKTHATKGCPWSETSRAGTRAEKAVKKATQVKAQEAAGGVMLPGPVPGKRMQLWVSRIPISG